MNYLFYKCIQNSFIKKSIIKCIFIFKQTFQNLGKKKILLSNIKDFKNRDLIIFSQMMSTYYLFFEHFVKTNVK